MTRPLTAERRRLVGSDACGDPYPRLPIHREAVRVGLARPDHIFAPVGRRLERLGLGFARGLGIADRQLDHARLVGLWIDHRQVVVCCFERAVNRAVRIDGGIALVRRNLVVQIRLRVRPVPHRHDDVAFLAGGSRRSNARNLAPGNPVGPVGKHGQRALAPHLSDSGAHGPAGLSRLDATIPGIDRLGEGAEALRDLTGRLVAKLVAARAPVGVDDVADPLALALDGGRDAVAAGACTGEVTRRRHLQERQPVLGRVVAGGRLCVGRPNGRQRQHAARRRFDLGRIHQAIAPHPDVVVGARQIRHEESTLVIGHDRLDQARREFRRFGDDPDPRLRPVRPRDNAPDVIVVDGHLSTGALAGTGDRQSCDDEREDGDRREREVEESSRHLAPPRVSVGRMRSIEMLHEDFAAICRS